MTTKPNAHDFDELRIIYQHLDSSSTVAAMSPMAAATSADVDVDESRPETWGTLVRQGHRGRSSLYEQHNRDGSRTVTHVFWTVEATTDCVDCDHRYDSRFSN